MAVRYEIPSDKYGRPLYNLTPVATALARTVTTPDSSELVTLNDDTRFIRVYAIAKDVYLKWASDEEDYCTAENFDEVIPAGQYMDFGVPIRQGLASNNGIAYDYCMVLGRESGSTAIVIEK